MKQLNQLSSLANKFATKSSLNFVFGFTVGGLVLVGIIFSILYKNVNAEIDDIRSGNVEARSILRDKLAEDVFTTIDFKLEDGTTATAKIINGGVMGGYLVSHSGTVKLELDDGTVVEGNVVATLPEIEDGSVTEQKLSQVLIEKINNIENAFELEEGSVITVHLANEAVTTIKLADGSVTTAKLLNGSITSGKLQDGIILTNHLGDTSVSAIKIQDGAITAEKILDNVVTTEKITNETIQNEDISNTAAIAWPKVSKSGSSLADLSTRNAVDVNIVDSGGYFATSNIESALQEIGDGTALNDLYVNVTGDTMTGTLNLPSNGLVVGTNQLVVSGGNVGIGTTDPGGLLQLGDSSGAPDIVFEKSGADSSYIYFKSGATEHWRIGEDQTEEFRILGTRSDEDFNLVVSDGGVSTEMFVIDASESHALFPNGNVGIGTTGPAEKLEVNGNIYLQDSDKVLLGAGKDGEIYSAGDDLYIANVTQDKDIIFQANDGGVTTEVLRIDGNLGNLGVGGQGRSGWLATFNTGPTSGRVSMGTPGGLPGVAVFDTGGGQRFNIKAYTNYWLLDNAGTGSLVMDNSGNVGIGTTGPGYKLSIGSTDASDQTGIYHNNTDAYFTTTDGSFVFKTDEGTDNSTTIKVQGKGTGYGTLRLYDPDDQEYLYLYMASAGGGIINTAGTSPGVLNLQSTAHAGVYLFESSASGENQAFRIYGYPSAAAAKDYASFQIVGANNDLQIQTNNASGDILLNPNSGNIGIGTTGPSSLLHLSTSGADTEVLRLDNTTGNQAYIGLRRSGTEHGRITTSYNGLSLMSPSGNGVRIMDSSSNVKVLIDNDGNVGIGTTGPSATLEVLDTTEQLRLSYDASNYTSFTVGSDGTLVLQTTGTDEDIELRTDSFDNAIFIDHSTSRIGIGTPSPDTIFHIDDPSNSGNSGNFQFTAASSTSSYTAKIELDNTGLKFGHNSGSRDLQFQVNSDTKMSIDTSGFVGIGTTSPQSTFHVPDGKYVQFEDNNAGAPPAADCDADAERGRLSIDTTNNRLYICNGAARGWDWIALSD